MNEIERQKLITTVLAREELRPLSRLERLLRSPWRTLPYYVLATAVHLKPFPITFQTLWKTKMTCYIQEGMSVIDVGAHIGIYSMLSAELVGTYGHVYGFEPTPWTFEILKKNTKKLPNVTIFNQAISETKQFLTFSDYGPGYGAYNSAHAAGAADMHKVAKKISVSSISLDAFCQEKSIQPDLIKIDAEGFEYEVLKGTKAILEGKTSKRPLITIEVAGGDAWAENREQTFTDR